MKHLYLLIVSLFCAAMVFSCADVEVNPAVSCNVTPDWCIKNIQVGDESVDDDGSTIEVSTAADAVVKWDYVEAGVAHSESETISAPNIKDGAVWTVYGSYVDY